MRIAFGILLALMPHQISALDLELPETAILVAETTESFDSLSLPVGPWVDGQIEVFAAEGSVSQQAWTLRNTALTTLQIMAPLRDAISAAGYQILYDCKDEDCGGFDFRYALPLLPEPDMHVDLGDFRYLAAASEINTSTDFIAITVSRSALAGFLHITRVGEPVAIAVPVTRPAPTAPALEPTLGTLASALDGGASFALDDLRFATGSADLEDAAFPSLAELAAWLRNSPERQVILVGHSDAQGALDRNISLSKRRAESVADRLASAHGIPEAQVRAEGIGFLAPRATNASPEGRARNRRVEVVPVNP